MRDKCGHPTQSLAVAFLCYNSCLLPLGRVMHANNIKMKLFLNFFVTPHCGLWDLSSPTWDETQVHSNKSLESLYIYIQFYLFIYLWLCWVFLAAWSFSCWGEWGLLSSYGSRASHYGGFSHCGAQAQ